MKLRHFALFAALALALFAARPGTAEAGVAVQVGPYGVYTGTPYGYYPYYNNYYAAPRYYYPEYDYPAYRHYRYYDRRDWRRHNRHWRRHW